MKTQQRLTFAVNSYQMHLIWAQLFSLPGQKRSSQVLVAEVLWSRGVFPTGLPLML